MEPVALEAVMCAPISLATASTAEQDTSGPAPTHVLCAPTRKEKPKTMTTEVATPQIPWEQSAPPNVLQLRVVKLARGSTTSV